VIDCDILLPGNYFCDLIFTGLPQFPELGREVYTDKLTVTVGGALNTVVALRRMGVEVGWIGQVGNDFFSRFVLETMEQEGVDGRLITRLDKSFQRATVALSYPHERAFISYIDPAPTPVEMVFEWLDRVRFHHLHFTSFQTHPRTVELFDLVRERGASISMDCQDHPIRLDQPGVREILSRLTIFMPNAREALHLTGGDSIESAAALLRPLVSTLVIKDGENGAYAWQGDAHWHAPAIPVNPIDTTGAGDVFNAGFLAAWRDGRPLDVCLRWGTICGGLSTLGKGGTSTAPHREVVEGWGE
jgi:sugar/nucleoside kinase (ribokinase family)